MRHADAVVEAALEVERLAECPRGTAGIGDHRLAEGGVGRREDRREQREFGEAEAGEERRRERRKPRMMVSGSPIRRRRAGKLHLAAERTPTRTHRASRRGGRMKTSRCRETCRRVFVPVRTNAPCSNRASTSFRRPSAGSGRSSRRLRPGSSSTAAPPSRFASVIDSRWTSTSFPSTDRRRSGWCRRRPYLARRRSPSVRPRHA